MLNDDRHLKDSTLSVINASGRQVSLLNDNGQLDGSDPGSPHSQHSSDEPTMIFNTAHTTTWMPPVVHSNMTTDQHQHYQQQQQQQQHHSSGSKRKYHCSEPGCNKSFTTSGHLARHNRIHTGEKNFPCLFPGCQSRFSRQDNMMQHYRTHMSPKSRRTPTTHSSSKRHSVSEESPSSPSNSSISSSHPRPRLHAHHRIRSDPYQVDPPLTIDQHISNYHRSLISPVSINSTSTSSLSSAPTPLSAIGTTNSNTQLSPSRRIFQRNQYHYLHSRRPSSPYRPKSSSPPTTIVNRPSIPIQPTTSTSSLSSSTSSTSSTSSDPPPPPPQQLTITPTKDDPSATLTFYQHRPLVYSTPDLANDHPSSAFTLLHPPPASTPMPLQPSSSPPPPTPAQTSPPVKPEKDQPEDSSLLQLAHIVSTFG